MEIPQYTEDIDFQKYWLVLKRHRLLASLVFVAIVVLANIYGATRKPTYEAQGKLLFKKRNTTSALITEAGEKLGQLDSLTQLTSPLETEAEVIAAIPIAQKTVEALQIKDKEGKLVQPEWLLKGLTVKGIKGTDVLLISYKSGIAEETAAVVNEIMKVYIENNILVNRSEAAAAREFITKELPEIETTLRQAEAELRRYQEENQIVALEEEGRAAVEIIAQLDTSLNRTQAALADATARTTALQQQIGLSTSGAIAVNSLSQSQAVQQVVGQLREVEDQLAVQRTRYRGQHPLIINLERKQASLQELLRERIAMVMGTDEPLPSANLQTGELQQKLTSDLVNAEVERLGLSNQLQAIANTQTAYKNRANILPKLQQGLHERERQVKAAQNTYEILLKNLQEVQIAENQNVGNARIIAPAQIPTAAVGPNKKLFQIGGVVVGGLLYVLTAFVLELIDPTIKTAKEVRGLFRYTLLGMIPKGRKKGFLFSKRDRLVPDLPVKNDPNSMVSESYRMLQANLRFSSPDKELKVIVVTSSVSREGKSTVAANLAIAMSQLGRQVLLIDGDLRHPLQHEIWDLTNDAGLSDAIVRQAEIEKVIAREVMDNLDVLPSGIIPPNPLTLLDSKRMASLIKEFSQTYNFIIIDTPPLVLVADALTLGKMTDGILLVVRPGMVDTASAAASKELLEQSGLEVLGLVVNGAIVENEPNSYFHHAKAYSKESSLFSTKLKPYKNGKKALRSPTTIDG